DAAYGSAGVQGLEFPAARRVPNDDEPIHVGGGDAAAVAGMKCHVSNSAGMAPESKDILAPLIPKRSCIPHMDGLVGAGGNQPVAVGAEGHAEDVVQMAPEREDFPAGGCVPELDGLIAAARRQVPAVGAEGHGHLKWSHVAAQAAEFLPRLCVPDLDRCV